MTQNGNYRTTRSFLMTEACKAFFVGDKFVITGVDKWKCNVSYVNDTTGKRIVETKKVNRNRLAELQMMRCFEEVK